MTDHADLIARLRSGIRGSNLTVDMTEKLMDTAAAALEDTLRERDEALACLDDAYASSPAVRTVMAKFGIALAFRERAEKAKAQVADFLDEKRAERAKAALVQARNDALEEAAKIASNGCLVPPDGGSPTENERLMCENIAAAIRALKDKS